jgi:glycosyltransferase involved in cell wall biosynthesis
MIFDPAFHRVEADSQTLTRLRAAGGAHLLFVGRVVPNKRLEDVILTFYYFKRRVDPQAHLHLVGSHHQMEPYRAYLQALVARLNLPDVHFEGHVRTAELVAFYRGADMFLCMSEHEGFGVPLIESMYYGLPVVAYAAAAVPETMGEAGILVEKKDFAGIAELLGLLLADSAWRKRLVRRQREWVRRFSPETVAATLRNHLRDLQCTSCC